MDSIERTPATRRLLGMGLAAVLTVGGLTSLVPSAAAQLDETSYETEHGHVIEWDDAWTVEENATGHDEQFDLDRIYISSGPDFHGDVFFVLKDYLDEDAVPADLNEDENKDTSTELLLDTLETDESSTSLSIMQTLDGLNGTFSTYVSIDDGDHVVGITIWAPVDEMGDAFEMVSADVEVDGDDPFVFAGFDQDDLDAAVETFDQVDPDTLIVEKGEETPDADDEETSESDDEETPEADDDNGDIDADDYLATVQDQYDEWSESYDRFEELFFGSDLTNEDAAEILEIFDMWAQAPDVAAELDAPAEYEEIQDAYETYAESLADVATTFDDYSAAYADDPDSAEADDALNAFVDSLDEVETTGAELEDLLADA